MLPPRLKLDTPRGWTAECPECGAVVGAATKAEACRQLLSVRRLARQTGANGLWAWQRPQGSMPLRRPGNAWRWL